MFGRHRKDHSRGFSPLNKIFGLFRALLSLFIMGVLVLGTYQAYKSFSGVDPLKLSPKAILENFLASEDAFELVNGILTANPQASLDKAKQILGDENQLQSSSNNLEALNINNSPTAFRFAVIADSHNDNQNLKKALDQAKEEGAKFILGLGDYSDIGTADELRAAKIKLDTIGLPYYLTVGDHDLWDSRDKIKDPLRNYQEIFGAPYSSFAYGSLRVILVYNSDNYLGLDGVQLSWLEDELARLSQEDPGIVFVALSIPLYHPSSDHIMGKEKPNLKEQAEHLISIFSKNGVDEVIAGDTHFYSNYNEPKTNLRMTTVGAITSSRNPQAPRFALIDIYEDGNYNIRDVEIK